jgi:predicted nucleotidyltransferase
VTDFATLIQTLADGRVGFILIGGVAATIHGSARLTRDVDVVYARTDENLARLVAALGPLSPYLRGAPPGLPFSFDVETLRRGLNFTLTTRAGDIDLLGEVTGGGGFDQLRGHATAVTVYGREVLCLDLDWLIRVKRAAGRPKDLEAVAELEILRDERRDP